MNLAIKPVVKVVSLARFENSTLIDLFHSKEFLA
jgi:hypothetical protein